MIRPNDLANRLEEWVEDPHLVKDFDLYPRYVGLVILLALKEHAAERVIEPGVDDYRAFTIIDGVAYEDEPPTPPMHRGLVAAARAIWKGDPYDETPFESTHQVTLGNLTAHVTLTVTPTPAGEVLRFQFSYPDENSVESPIPEPAAVV